MAFPNYMLMPFEKHIDGGFGAMAEAFEEAANMLANDEKASFANSHLPINFLYRHAIELYLKSVIVVIHKSLNLSSGGSQKDSEPYILVKGKPKSIYNVHDVRVLYTNFKRLVTENKQAIDKIAETDWAAFPPELETAISVVADVDSTSTYFRYPDTGQPQTNKKKSSWKETNPTDVVRSIKKVGKPAKVFVTLDDQDNVVNLFKFDYEPLGNLRQSLEIATTLLGGAHLGLRSELAGGN